MTTGEDSVIQEVVDTIQEIDRKIQELFDSVKDALDWVPDFLSFLIDPVKDAVAKLNKKLDEFWATVREFITQRGRPGRLREVGSQWSDAIGNVIEDVAGSISLEKLKTQVEWEGRAAETYKSSVPAQVNGLNTVKDLSIQMRNSMNDLANGIDSFWIMVRATLTGLAIAVVAAILGAATVVGIPAALVVLVGIIGAVITAICTAIGGVDSLVNTVAAQQNAIADKIKALGSQWANTDTGGMSGKSAWEVR